MPAGQNFSHYLRSLQILFFALMAGQIMVCLMLWVIRKDTGTPEYQEDLWLQALGIFTLLLLGGSIFFRKKMVENARAQKKLSDKFAQYRQSLVISWALMEGATMVNAIFFFLSGKMEFLYLAGAVIGFFATQAPLRARGIYDLELSWAEQNSLDDPDAAVMDPPAGGD